MFDEEMNDSLMRDRKVNSLFCKNNVKRNWNWETKKLGQYNTDHLILLRIELELK